MIVNPLYYLFNDRSKRDKSIAVIVDFHGMTEIDKEYRDLGVEEGWLVLIGMHRDEFERLVYRYRYRPPNQP